MIPMDQPEEGALPEIQAPPGFCIHVPLEPEKNWCVVAVPSKGIFLRVCKKCRLVYADLRFPTETKEIAA